MDLITRVAIWWRRATCSHPYRRARFRWVEEYVIYYWECPVDEGGCGAEWDDGT